MGNKASRRTTGTQREASVQPEDALVKAPLQASVAIVPTPSKNTPVVVKALSLHLKCRYEKQLRGIQVESSMQLSTIYERLENAYGFAIELSYDDADGDTLVLQSQMDLEELHKYCLERKWTSLIVHVERKDKTRVQPLEFEDDPDADDGESDIDGPEEDKRIRWRRGELLGQGAFGKVFLALNLADGNLIAVKQMEANETQLKQITALEQEIALIKGLNHKHVVRYLGTERFNQTLSIFLEYMAGGSIAHLLARFGALDENMTQMYLKQILLGLEHLHSHNIVHRDIKGANILLDSAGVIKLSDFGGSAVISDDEAKGLSPRETMSSARGSAYWMAPEVIRHHATQNGWKKADIWSVGCTVIEMLTGKPPWSNFSNPVTALYQIACRKSPPPFPPDASESCKSFLSQCFFTDPSQRPTVSLLLQHAFVTGTKRGITQGVARNTPCNVDAQGDEDIDEVILPDEKHRGAKPEASRQIGPEPGTPALMEEVEDDFQPLETLGHEDDDTNWQTMVNPINFDPMSLVMHNYSKDHRNYGVSTVELQSSLQHSLKHRSRGARESHGRRSNVPSALPTLKKKALNRNKGKADPKKHVDKQLRKLQEGLVRAQQQRRDGNAQESDSD